MKRIIISFFSLGIIIANAQPLAKAVVKKEYIDSIIKEEENFEAHYTTTAPANTSWFEFRKGTIKILFIAGHATTQIRQGQVKAADGGTGSLAVELHKLKDVSVLYTTYQSPSDPNFEDDNEFKDTLAKIVAAINPVIVIDLHGSHPYRPYDVDFGTMNKISYLTKIALFNKLKSTLRNEGLINQSQDFFSAATNQTITKYLYNRNVPCVQLEINSTYLSPKSGDLFAQRTAQLLQGLIRFIDTL